MRNGGAIILGSGTMLGLIIGAGIFGIPFVYSQGGVLWGVLLTIVVGSFVVVTNLMLAEISLRTKERLRLPKMARIYLGNRAGWIQTFADMFSVWGAMLAYTIAAGTFTVLILSPFVQLDVFLTQIVLFVLMASVALTGRKLIARLDVALTFALIIAIFILLATSFGHVVRENITMFNFNNAFTSYGVIIFSLSGLFAVPTVVDLMKRDREKIYRSVLIGPLIAMLITIAFGVVVAGVSGVNTSEEGIMGLVPILGPGVTMIGAVIGLLAVVTSFWVMVIYIRDMFMIDVGLKKPLALAMTLLPPFIAFLLGARSFISVLGFTGAIFGSIAITMVCMSYISAKRLFKKTGQDGLMVPHWVPYIVIALFLTAVVGQIIKLF